MQKKMFFREVRTVNSNYWPSGKKKDFSNSRSDICETSCFVWKFSYNFKVLCWNFVFENDLAAKLDYTKLLKDDRFSHFLWRIKKCFLVSTFILGEKNENAFSKEWMTKLFCVMKFQRKRFWEKTAACQAKCERPVYQHRQTKINKRGQK